MVIDYSLPRRFLTALQGLRSVLFDKETDLDFICQSFVDYSSIDEYVSFENVIDKRRILSLVPKRGNVRYASGVKKRFNELIIPFEVEPAKDVLLVDGKTNCLYLTLTYDTKLCDFKTAWLNIGVELNRFASGVKKRFGRALIVARCFEAFNSGYVHVHLILYFFDYSFPTFKRFSKKSGRDIWRIDTWERDKFRSYWHSNIDVQGMQNMHESLRYLEKYIAKASNLALNDPDNKGLKTLALSWAFRKRSFSVSRKFKEQIVFKRYLSLPAPDLNRLTVIQTVPAQVTLGLSAENGSGEFGGVPVLDSRDFVKWSMKSKAGKKVSNWIRRKQHFRKADFKFWGCGGFPKDKLGFDTAFSFGLSDAQSFVVSQFLGDMTVEGESSSNAVRCALEQKLASGKLNWKPLKFEDCRELRVADYVRSKPKPLVEDQPVSVESLEGLSGLALMAHKLRLAHDLLPAQKSRVNPSLTEDGNVRFYD
jgi:hypothetical protein